MEQSFCTNCDERPGTGRCRFCHGAGMTITGNDCVNCSGSGVCHYCGGARVHQSAGSGALACSNCQGSGVSLVGEPCSYCRGTGFGDSSAIPAQDAFGPVIQFGGWFKSLVKALWGAKE